MSHFTMANPIFSGEIAHCVRVFDDWVCAIFICILSVFFKKICLVIIIVFCNLPRLYAGCIIVFRVLIKVMTMIHIMVHCEMFQQ